MPKVVVITGASSGIGAALARQLGAQGHQLVLGARRRAQLEEVANSAGPAAISVVTDVTRRAAVEHLRDIALENFNHIDVWVNNAGRGISRSVQELTDEDVDAMIAVNLKSYLYGMQAVLPHFKERGTGQIINVSSFLGRVPMVTVRSAYAAAKSALNSLSANLRMELMVSHPGIKVSVVMPGIVTTDFAASVLGAKPGAQFRPGANVRTQTAEEVASIITGLLENPVAEVYTIPGQQEFAQRYFADVTASEQGLVAGPRT